MVKTVFSVFALSSLLFVGLPTGVAPAADASKQKPKIPEHKCCHNGQCCGTKDCCDKNGCHSIKCPKIKDKDKGKDKDKDKG